MNTAIAYLSSGSEVNAAPILVRAEALSKRFSSALVLDTLDFELRAGEVVALLGPNGAGKTTTLKLLLGLLRPSAGKAQVLGLDSTHDSQRVREHVGYSPDEPQFYAVLTGRESLDFVISVRGLDRTAAWSRLHEYVAALDFGAQLDELTSSYSHGMKKKLALLCALAHRPRVLLLDEPTNGLDPQTAARVRELLRAHAAAGNAVLISTHLLDMAERICDRMLVLRRGRKLAEGTIEQLRAIAGLAPGADLEAALLKLLAD